MKKRLLSALLCLCMVVCMMPTVSLAANETSGSCGDNVTWLLSDDGTLTISGTGAMQDYTSSSSVPWNSIKNNIKTVVIESGVTSIGSSAFYYCSNLTSVTIPDGVTSIGNSAFQQCGKLADVTIPSGVTSIGEYAFSSCKKLTSVTIPDGVTSIGSHVFAYCSELTKVEIPDSVTSIGAWAFGECKKLTSVKIPDNVTSIGRYAFYYCEKLSSVTIPSGVTSISDATFYFCGNLSSVTIPNSVTSIGKNAFTYCTSLTSIEIPNSVTSIGEYAFSNCRNLTSVSIPDSVTNIENYTFYFCFELANVEIPDSVTSIGYRAFGDCKKLTSVKIPDSVTSIEEAVFQNCIRLTNIAVGEQNKNYSSEDGVLFNKNKTELLSYPINRAGESYSIPDGVTSIGSYAFCSSSNLTSVTIPDGVTSIKELTFYKCSNLTSVKIPDSVTSIENSAFAYCSKLTSVTIPDSVTSIGDYAFNNCSKLTSVTIPDSVMSIGNYVLYSSGYYNQESNWKDGILYCGNWVIDTKKEITTANIAKNTIGIANSAFSSSQITSVTIPDNVRNIGNDAFAYCRKLTSVTIPSSVTSIEDSAFLDCTSLTNMTIPESVVQIGKYAFGIYYTSGSYRPIKGFIANVKPNSAAETYCKTNRITFENEHTEEAIAAKEATCTEDGHTAGKRCSNCGAILEGFETVNAAHKWNDGEVTKPATCTEAGVKTYTCTVCNETKTEDIPVIEHTWDSGKITKEATCTATGVKTYTCTVCGATKTEDIAKIDHTPVTDAAVAPTCTEAGKTEGSHCSVCGEVLKAQETVKATGHKWDAGKVTKEATCTATGIKTYTCTVCEATKTEDIAKIDHTPVTDAAVAPTCTKAGKTEGSHCSVCGEVIKAQEEIPATGEHTWDAGKITKEATCTAIGVKTYTCTVCGATKTEDIAKIDHAPVTDAAVEPTCTKAGKTEGSHCEVCGEVIKAQEEIPATGEHTWDAGKITKEATCTATGVKTYTCTVCGATKTEDIAKIDHTPVTDAAVEPTYTTEGKTEGSHCSVCGEIIKAQETIPALEKPEPTPSISFTDVDANEYYATPVQWAVERGITNGMGDNKFEPNTTCTRGQIVTFLWRAKGSPEPTSTNNPFTDVPENEYYYKAVLWAVEQGITTGTSATTFSPNQGCTRGQVATFLWRAEGKPSSSVSNQFSDVDTSEYYGTAVLWASEKGITNGMGDGTFAPNATCTRGQIVTFLYRAMA